MPHDIPAPKALTAVIMAGGKGLRLSPYTDRLPKPLLPVAGKPIIHIILEQLAFSGFEHIIISLNHAGEQIEASCGDGARWGLPIQYYREEEALGTLGCLAHLEDLPSRFLVINGDILTDIPYGDLLCNHRADDIITIATWQHQLPVPYGVISADAQGKITGFVEKPEQRFSVAIGAYALSRQAVSLLDTHTKSGLDTLMSRVLAQGLPSRVSPHEGFWLDIGDRSSYEEILATYDEGDYDVLRARLGMQL